MRLDYHAESDSLDVDLSERPTVDSHLVAPGISLTFDRSGKVVGMRVERASETVDWRRLDLDGLPLDAGAVITSSGRDVQDLEDATPVPGGHPSDQVDDYTGAAQQEGAE